LSSDVVETKEFRAVAQLMNRLSVETDLDPVEANKADILAIMENILAAETPEELWARQEAGGTSSKDYTNQPFTLKSEDVVWKKSTIVGPTTFPYYAMCKVIDVATGNEVMLNGGGFSFVSVISKLQDFEMLDGVNTFQLVEKATSSGNTVILVKPVAIAPVASAKRAGSATK
jgi:hypothetical protein